jgi:hypothetical protein
VHHADRIHNHSCYFSLDGGGTLDIEELDHGIKAYGIDLTSVEVQKLFNMIDLDQEGEIQPEEFEHFVKAELESIALEEDLAHMGSSATELDASLVAAVHGGARFLRTDSVAGDLTLQVRY